MTDKTHCDRCGNVGPLKDGRPFTTYFPGRVEICGFNDPMSESRDYDLCWECSKKLARFVDDTEMLEMLEDMEQR